MSETLFLVVLFSLLFLEFGLFLSSAIGNAVVIYVISSDEKLKSKSNYHILSVAIVDLLIGLFGIPLCVISVMRMFILLSLK